MVKTNETVFFTIEYKFESLTLKPNTMLKHLLINGLAFSMLFAGTAVNAQNAMTKTSGQSATMHTAESRSTPVAPRQERRINPKFLKNITDQAKGTASSTESFEGSFPPQCWTQIDADGDGYVWFQVSPPSYTVYDGEFAAASASYLNPPGPGAVTPDNYLVSPHLSVGTDNSLTYYVATQDIDYPSEQYGVYVSTGGNATAAEFTDEMFVETLTDTEWALRTIDLSAYEGQDIYIAFRHFGVTDQFQMKIDMVTLPGEIIDCILCDYPEVTADNVICGEEGWSYELTFDNVPTGSSYTLSNSADGTTHTVDAAGSFTSGPFANGQEVTFTLTNDDVAECTEDIVSFAGDCTEPCMSFVDGPWIDLDDLGLPTPDAEGNCETVTIESFEVYGSESYILSELPGDATYTFSACTGPGAGTYPISYTVIDTTSGDVVAFGNDGDGCSISWETGAEGGTFVVIITYEGYCGTAIPVDNGYPSVTCMGVEGLNEHNYVDMALYPNPTTGELTLTTPITGMAEVSVFDALGRVVKLENIDVSNNATNLNVSALDKGVYILQVRNDQGIAVEKFIKR